MKIETVLSWKHLYVQKNLPLGVLGIWPQKHLISRGGNTFTSKGNEPKVPIFGPWY